MTTFNDAADEPGWTEFEYLLRAIDERNSSGVDWAWVTERFLRHCLLYPPSNFELGTEHDLLEDQINAVTQQVLAVIGEEAEMYPDSVKVGRLLDVLAAELEDSQKGPSAAVARGAAVAIDLVHGPRFMHAYKATKDREYVLETGRAFPVLTHFPGRLVGTNELSSDPANLPGREMDEVPHLRLAGDATRSYRFVLDFSLWGLLPTLSEPDGLKIACLQPTETLDDYDLDPMSVEEDPLRNFGPLPGHAQTETLKGLVRTALDKGARVIVLPEYSMSVYDRDDVREVLNNDPERPALFVGGLAPARGAEAKAVNRAWICVTAGPELTVAKMFPAAVGTHVEDIAPADEVRVFVCEEWTIAVLICRDAMSSELVDQLAKMGVNLLLVPAMSPKTTVMERLATQLCGTTQAFVAIANGPARWKGKGVVGREKESRAEAVFDGPYEAAAHGIHCPRDVSRSSNGPALWLFSAETRTAEFIASQ